MKRLLLSIWFSSWFLLGLASLVFASCQSSVPPPGYVLTFSDTFATNDICPSATYSASCQWWNGTEQCCLTPSDSSGSEMFPTTVPGKGGPVNPYALLAGGGVSISLANYNTTTGALNSLSTGATSSWNSGVMTSMTGGQGFAQKYGYFEMVAQLPAGAGVWPGFWMLPSGSPGNAEIDIFEAYGVSPGYFCTTVHDYSGTGTVGSCGLPSPGSTSGYHAYGMLWTATTMTFYVDGVQVWTTPTPTAAQQSFYILADLGIGSGWPTTATPSPSAFNIKSIKAWQGP